MNENPSANLRMTVYASLFAALTIIGGYLSFPIPVSPIPIVLADFFVMLAGLLLGASWGFTSIGLFVFLGIIGLPVFAGGKAGLAVFFGPTGGFLLGYLACALVVGVISGRGKPSTVKDVVALVAGNVVLYAFGVSWLKMVVSLPWEGALAVGLLPFIPGLIVKVVAASALARVLRPRFHQMTSVPLESVEE